MPVSSTTFCALPFFPDNGPSEPQVYGEMRVSNGLMVVCCLALASCIGVTKNGKRYGVSPGVPMTSAWDAREQGVRPFDPLPPPTGNPFLEDEDGKKPPPLSPTEEAAIRTTAAIVAAIATGQLPILEIFAAW